MTAGFKQTEIGLIPNDWEVKSVGEEYDICNNLRLPISAREREKMSGSYPYYGPTKIQDHINEYRVEGKYALIGEDGDHFLKYESLPQTQLATGKFNVNNHAHLIRGRKYTAEWFYFFFRNRDITKYLTRQGAGRFKLNKASLEKLPCVFPSIDEQKAIAQALSDVDALITALEKLITKKQAIKTATMQQLLTGKTRLPGFGDGQGMQQTELGEIPEDWEVCELSELCTISGLVRGPFGGALKKSIFVKTGYTVYEQRHAISASLGVTRYYIDEKKFDELKRFQVDSGDLIVSCSGTIGKIFKIPEGSPKGIINQALLKIRLNEKIDSDFFMILFRSPSVQSLIVDNSHGGAMPNLVGMEDFKKVVFQMPTLEEQEAIAGVLSDMDAAIAALQKRLQKTKAIKQGMMQELLTGRTRLVDPTPHQPPPTKQSC